MEPAARGLEMVRVTYNKINIVIQMNMHQINVTGPLTIEYMETNLQ